MNVSAIAAREPATSLALPLVAVFVVSMGFGLVLQGQMFPLLKETGLAAELIFFSRERRRRNGATTVTAGRRVVPCLRNTACAGMDDRHLKAPVISRRSPHPCECLRRAPCAVPAEQ